MSLTDDLRATAVSAAAQAVAPFVAADTPDPIGVGRAAVDAARPYLDDALRVEQALAARQPEEPMQRHVPRTPDALWAEAGSDEHRYVDLMIQNGYLTVATVDRFSVSDGDDTVAP